MNFVNKSKQPFTVKKIIKELELSSTNIRSHIEKMIKNGNIRQVGTARCQRIYCSQNYQGDGVEFMSNYDKIMHFINNLKQPFTVKMIEKELNLTYHTVTQCIHRIVLKGNIKLIDVHKNAKVYVLNTNQENVAYIMTSYDKIKNFVIKSTSPFTIKEIACELDLSPPAVRKHFKGIIKEGLAMQVGTAKTPKQYCSKNHQGNNTFIMTNYDKIMNAILFSSSPFTTQQIASELDLPYGMVKRHLCNLRKKRHIKQIYIENGFKVYVSNIFQGNIPAIKNSYNKIKNYIYYLSRPFTVKMVIDELGISHDAVRKYFPEMIKEGYIKFIGRDKMTKVYILNRQYGKESIKKR